MGDDGLVTVVDIDHLVNLRAKLFIKSVYGKSSAKRNPL